SLQKTGLEFMSVIKYGQLQAPVGKNGFGVHFYLFLVLERQVLSIMVNLIHTHTCNYYKMKKSMFYAVPQQNTVSWQRSIICLIINFRHCIAPFQQENH